jgi:hypothetical protein
MWTLLFSHRSSIIAGFYIIASFFFLQKRQLRMFPSFERWCRWRQQRFCSVNSAGHFLRGPNPLCQWREKKKNMSNSEIPTSSQGKVTQIKIADNEPRQIVLLN